MDWAWTEWGIKDMKRRVLLATKDAKLEDAAKGWIEAVKRDIPGTKRFKIFSETMVTLEDGTQAAAYTLKWNWTDGVTKLQTAAVTAYKGEKSVTVTATTVLGGETTPDKLLEMCKTLKFYKKGLF